MRFYVIGYQSVTYCEKVYFTVEAPSADEAKRIVEAGDAECDEAKCIECTSSGPVEVEQVEAVPT